MADHDCEYCGGHHDDRYLCDVGKRVLDQLVARHMVMTTPILEFPEAPIYTADLPGDDVVLAEITVQAATVPIDGTTHLMPALVFSGSSLANTPVPRRVYATSTHEMLRFVNLVERMAQLAIRTAARGGQADAATTG